MKRKVSLKDIAQKMGVSTALVSYVLNNKKTERINKEVAKKIKETALALNYQTNHIARSLKTNKTLTIGLIVSNISNSFSATLARIIEDEAEKNNYTVLFGSSDENAQKSLKLINILLNHQVDGLIFAPSEDAAAQINYLLQTDVPFVLIDRYFPDIDCSHVAIDNFKASFAITQHLINTGRKRIGIINFNSKLFNLQERTRGYKAALKQNKLAVKKSWVKEVSHQHTNEDVIKAINELLNLPEPVDALLFASNTLSISGLKYINTLPVKVPKALSIASFDESEAAQLFYAPVTHIKQPLEEMGQLATKILLERIEGNKKFTKLDMDAALVICASTKNKT